MLKFTSTPNAPSAIGPYSQAVAVNGILFTSGQVALMPGTGEIVGTTIEEQAEQVCKNLAAVLEANGLIKLNPDAGVTATKLDITENPYNLEIVEMEAAQLPLSLGDLGFAAINANYALQNKLTQDDALATEDASGDAAQTYANIIAVKKGNENSDKIKALVAALETDAVKDYIANTYNGAVVAIF